MLSRFGLDRAKVQLLFQLLFAPCAGFWPRHKRRIAQLGTETAAPNSDPYAVLQHTWHISLAAAATTTKRWSLIWQRSQENVFRTGQCDACPPFKWFNQVWLPHNAVGSHWTIFRPCRKNHAIRRWSKRIYNAFKWRSRNIHYLSLFVSATPGVFISGAHPAMVAPKRQPVFHRYLHRTNGSTWIIYYLKLFSFLVKVFLALSDDLTP